MVGRDLVACSRFWARDRVATAVVRGASPFWKSSFVRATNRHGRDHPANLPLSLGVVGRPRRVAEAPECHWFSTSRRSWPLGKGPLSSSRRECQIKIPKRLPFGAIMSAKCICHFCLEPWTFACGCGRGARRKGLVVRTVRKQLLVLGPRPAQSPSAGPPLPGPAARRNGWLAVAPQEDVCQKPFTGQVNISSSFCISLRRHLGPISARIDHRFVALRTAAWR